MQTPIIQSIPVWLQWNENWLYRQLRHLPPGEFDTHIVCASTANLDEFSRPNIHAVADGAALRRFGGKWANRARRWWRPISLEKWGHRTGAKLVHSHFGNVAWEDRPAVRAMAARHVATFYGYDASRLPASSPAWRRRYASLFAEVDKVLCEGAHMRQTLLDLGCPPDKALVHPLGVEVGEIAFVPRRWTPDTPLRVLLVGRFTEKKGFPDALAALARLRKDIELEITIIGDARPNAIEQGEKMRITAAIERHGLRDCMRLLGFQPPSVVFKEAYDAHLFISPSVTASDGDTEGGAPVILIDMAASGMPIVSTRHCDIPAVVLDGKTGLLAGEHDIDGLVDRLSWFIQHPSEWEPMLAAGRSHIEKRYDVAEQGRTLARIYRNLLG